MKIILRLCFACLLWLYGIESAAQKAIVFDSTSHTVSATKGGVYVFQLNDFSPPLGEKAEWLYGDALTLNQATGYQVQNYIKSTNTLYPNSYRNDSIFVNITPALGFYTNAYLRQSAASWAEYNLDNPQLQTFPLTALSGGANDVLTIPAQTIAYSSPRTLIQYPATYGSVWKSDVRYVATSNLTVEAYGLNKVPLSLVKNLSSVDSVVAWGKANIPFKGGKVSKQYDVLIMKKTTIRQDSFYLGGQPAPVPLMTAFGITQGSRDTAYRYIAYRLDSPNYLFILFYGNDASMSLQPRLGITDVAEAALPSALTEEATKENTSLSPNPANDEITVTLHKSNDAPWEMELYSSLGTKVESRCISAGYGESSLHFSVAHLPAGSYSYVLRDEQKRIVSTQRFIIAR